MPAKKPEFQEGGFTNTGRTNGLGEEAIREQLDRILASPAFRSSKRYSSFLRYVVERALQGDCQDLKERTIGVDVFGRPADYDTSTDHVVRSVAGEVRRRLAQYYLEEADETEIRIELQPGSYVPIFRAPQNLPQPLLRTEAPAVAPPATESAVAEMEKSGSAQWWKSRKPAALAAVAALAGISTLLGAWYSSRQDAFERFWAPVLNSPHAVQLCFGGGRGGQQAEDIEKLTVREFEQLPGRRMHVYDALVLASLVGAFQARGKPYRVLNRAHLTSYKDLQAGPFVLIGAMNNEWTLRLTEDLRFGFEAMQEGAGVAAEQSRGASGAAAELLLPPRGARVVDRQHPEKAEWSIYLNIPMASLSKDYGLVTRLRDPKTEQIAVIVGGLGAWGTLAAGEFVTKPEHLRKLELIAPQGWEKKNLQVVISTEIIRGSPGPPNIVAAHFW